MDKIAIYNLALAEIGAVDAAVAETDTSTEKLALERNYPLAMAVISGAYDWSCNRRQVQLARLDAPADAEMQYVYHLPADCLAVRRVYPNRTVYIRRGRNIYTNASKLTLEYTCAIECGDLPATLVELLSNRLAARVAPGLRSDSAGLVNRLDEKYFSVLLPAAIAAENRERFPGTRGREFSWRDAVRFR